MKIKNQQQQQQQVEQKRKMNLNSQTTIFLVETFSIAVQRSPKQFSFNFKLVYTIHTIQMFIFLKLE